MFPPEFGAVFSINLCEPLHSGVLLICLRCNVRSISSEKKVQLIEFLPIFFDLFEN